MEPRIIIKPAFTVVGISHKGEAQDERTENLWEQLNARFHEIPGADPDTGYGVHCWNGSERKYLAGMAVRGADKIEIPEGMTSCQLDNHAYVVFPHCGSTDQLDETINWIYDTWLPGSRYQSLENYFFELYDDHFQPGSEDSILFIFVPVEEK
jgi:AraC family transcriptional regulator